MKSWVYGYDTKTKAQFSQWKSPESPHPKKAQQSFSNVKAVLSVLSLSLPHDGVIHHEYAPPGRTLTNEYYLEVLRWLRDAIRRKWPQFWARGDQQFHHNNAPAHSSALMQAFFDKTSYHPGLSVALQPRFSPLWLLAFPKANITVEREEICECDSHTTHKASQWCLTADWLAPWESDCLQMRSKVSSDWLPSYIKAMRPFLKCSKWTDTFRTDLVHWLMKSSLPCSGACCFLLE